MDVGIKTANDQFQTVTTAQRATLTPTVGQAVWDSDLKQLMVFMNASGGNAWQPVGNRIVCASTTRPSSPFEGQEIYETDSQKTLVYSGSAWVETNDLDYSPSATVCTSSTRPTTGLFEGQRIYETDTNKEFTYSGSGWVQTNQWSTTSGVTGVNNLIVPPMVRATRSTNQSITGATETTVDWNAEDFDTDSMHDTSVNPSRITINTAGIYLFTAGLNFGSSTGATTQIFLRHNGSTVFGRTIYDAAATATSVAAMYKCAVSDYVEVRVYIGTGRNVGADAATYFSALWLGRDS